MKTYQKAAGMAAVVALLFTGSAFAQVSEDGLGKVLPIELYVCNYNDGKNAADLDAVISRWTDYMDENGTDDYAAWTLTPYHYGPDQEFDVLWMGAWTDGNAMGAGIDTWLATGGELQEAFNEVLDCNAHVLLGSAMYKSIAGGGATTSGIITMMDCELNEGHEYSDIQAAELKWAEYLTSNGSNAGYFHWFPTFGGGDAEFDYKVVFAYANYAELGANFERVANAGGRETSQEIFGDIDECDDARVYIATNQRAAQLRETE